MPTARTPTSGTAASSANPFTITLPASTTTGDIIILIVANAGTTGPATPSGWNTLGTVSAGTAASNTVFWAPYSGGLTLNFVNAASVAAWCCNSYSGADTVLLDPDANTNSTTNNTTLPTGAPTSGTAVGDYEVLLYSWTSAATITTPASGSTIDKTQANSTSVSACLGHNNTTSLGANTATTAFSHTLSANNTRKSGRGLLLRAYGPRASTGALAAGSAAPIDVFGTVIAPAVGSLSLASAPPTVSGPVIEAPLAGSLSLTGQVLIVTNYARGPPAGELFFGLIIEEVVYLTDSAGNLLVDSAGNFIVSSRPPSTSDLSVSLSPLTGALVGSGNPPSANAGATIAALPGELFFGLVIPTSPSAQPSAGALSIAGAAPFLGQLTAITPVAASLTLVGNVPTLLQAVLKTPSAGVLTLTGVGPALIQNNPITPATGPLVLGSAIQPIIQNNLVAPAAGLLSLTAQSPATAPQPLTGSLSIQGAQPTIQAGAGSFVTVNTGGLSIAGQTAANGIQPVSGSLQFGTAAPALLRNTFIAPAVGTLALSGQSAAAPQPSTGALSIQGGQPNVQAGAGSFVTVNTGALSASGQTPGNGLQPSTGTLTITGRQPGPSFQAPNGTLTLQSDPPVVQAGAGIAKQPLSGALTLVGYAFVAQSPQTGSLALFGLNPVGIQNWFNPPGSGSLTIIGSQAGASRSITPASGTLSLATVTPVNVQNIERSPAVGILTLSPIQTGRIVGTLAAASAGGLTLSGAQSGVSRSISPSTGSLTFTGGFPLMASADLRPKTGELFFGLGGPSNPVITPNTGQLFVLSVPQPSNTNLTPLPGELFIGFGGYWNPILNPIAGSLSITPATPTIGRFTATGVEGSLSLTGRQPIVQISGAGVTNFPIAPASGEAFFGIGAPGVQHFRSPSTGTLNTAGQQAGMGSPSLQPAAGSLTLTTAQAIIAGRPIVPITGKLIIGLKAPDAPRLSPNTGSLSLSGATAITAVLNVPTPGSLTLTGSQPVVAIKVDITPASGSLVLTPQAGQIGLATGTGSLLLSSAAPSLVLSAISVPPAGSLAIGGQPPTQGSGQITQSGSLVLSGSAPQFAGGITPSTCSLNLAGTNTNLSFSATPPAGALAIQGQQSVVVGTASAFATPGAGSLNAQGYNASFLNQSLPSSGGLILAGAPPTVLQSLAPNAQSLVLAGQAPSLLINAIIQTPAGALNLTGQALVGVRGEVRQPQAGALFGQGATVATSQGIAPQAGTLAFQGTFPSQQTVIQPSSGALTLLSAASSLREDVRLEPDTGELEAEGQGTGQIERISITPSRGSLIVTGIPVGEVRIGDMFKSPGAGSLTLTGEVVDTPVTFAFVTLAFAEETMTPLTITGKETLESLTSITDEVMISVDSIVEDMK